MPWEHCGATVLDDAACPACGAEKTAWTFEFEVTRTFKVSPRAGLRLALVDLDDAPVTGEPVRFELEGGALDATLDELGQARAPADARVVAVSFPARRAADVRPQAQEGEEPAEAAAADDGPAPRFEVAPGARRHVFQLLCPRFFWSDGQGRPGPWPAAGARLYVARDQEGDVRFEWAFGVDRRGYLTTTTEAGGADGLPPELTRARAAVLCHVALLPLEEDRRAALTREQCVRVELAPRVPLPKPLVVTLPIDPHDPETVDDVFTLRSDDGEVERTLTMADDARRDDALMTLAFGPLPPGKRYTLEYRPTPGCAPQVVFDGATPEELLGLEPAAEDGPEPSDDDLGKASRREVAPEELKDEGTYGLPDDPDADLDPASVVMVFVDDDDAHDEEGA